MSSIAATPLSSALPVLETHAHGHKKGVHSSTNTDPSSTDNSPSSTDSTAGSSTQNLFSSLLQSVEQIVGVGASVVASRVPGATAALGALTGAGSTSNKSSGLSATAPDGASSSATANRVGSNINISA